ncbi:MAG: CoA transferase [Gammaproteobacteria bacterium]|nr:MAG: CoA transferase [Gammaproteobacteria bacterium]
MQEFSMRERLAFPACFWVKISGSPHRFTSPGRMSQAFSGIRIIDFTQVLAGPFATQQLALLGADVIKIEERTNGDQTRGLLNDTPGANPGMAPSFLSCNLGKRSLTLDLKSPHATDIVHRLVKSADVVVENFRAGVMDRLGFGYEALKAVKEDLIYCSVSGYGQSGPKAGTPAYDGAIQADSGMMAITGHPETGPTRTGYMPVDMGTALNTAFAISAALYRRLATGEGQRLDVAMMDTAMVLQTPQVSNYLINGVVPELFGNRSPTRQPTANSFATRDGYMNLVALKEPQAAALFNAIGRSDVLEDERLKTAKGRMSHYDEIAAIIAAELEKKTTAEWLQIFASEKVPAAPIRNYPEVVTDPQFDHRQAFITFPKPGEEPATVDLIRAGYQTDRDGPDTPLPPPKHGEHTNEILIELGYDEAAIASLRAEQAI